MKEFDYDMITRYLDGVMNAEEMKTFETLMLQDVELKNEFDLLNDVNTTLKIKLHPGENELSLRNSLQDLRGEYFSTKIEQAKIIPLSRRKWMMAAAAVFVMALLLTVWQYPASV